MYKFNITAIVLPQALIKNVTRIAFTVLAICNIVACIIMPEQPPLAEKQRGTSVDITKNSSTISDPFPNALPDEIITRMGIYNSVRVFIKCESSPIPFNKVHAWKVYIETSAGVPVTDAIINVDAGMLSDKHALSTPARITNNLDNGYYTLENVNFNKRGEWKLILSIISGFIRDKVIFDIQL